MRFVIVGYGRVGRRVARILASEDHEVLIVELDADKADRARTDGFETYQGDGQKIKVLERADLARADAVGALTGDVTTNFTACMYGAEHDCRTVLRIDEDYRAEIYEKYAADVDEIIYPERLGAAGAKTALLGGDFNVLAELTEQLSLASIRVPEESPVVGQRVVELDLPGDAHVYTHGRAKQSMTIPLPRTTIEPGDNIGVLADPAALEDVRATLRGT
jgi:trk system potassium uptake protein TrkA